MRDSCGKSVSKETAQTKAEGGPPAESEYQEWKFKSNTNNILWSACDIPSQKGYNLNFL
ncbi:hypothetical protein GCM10009597_08120 [Peribacillus frigoritolerans]